MFLWGELSPEGQTDKRTHAYSSVTATVAACGCATGCPASMYNSTLLLFQLRFLLPVLSFRSGPPIKIILDLLLFVGVLKPDLKILSLKCRHTDCSVGLPYPSGRKRSTANAEQFLSKTSRRIFDLRVASIHYFHSFKLRHFVILNPIHTCLDFSRSENFFSQVWTHLMFLDKFYSNSVWFVCAVSQRKKWNSNWSWISRCKKNPRAWIGPK